MNLKTQVPLHAWTIQPPSADVKSALVRLSRADDVRRIAVMPDVHLAGDVCVGTVLATNTLVYPSAVGGDIGCGMAAVAFDCDASVIDRADVAPLVLNDFTEAIPIERHHRSRPINERIAELANEQLSDPSLERLRARDGVLQFGTLGRGNHFVELQRDEDDRLWLMIHTGSRGMGQAIHTFHMQRAARGRGGLNYLDTTTDSGHAYLHDMNWARRYAHHSRLAIMDAVAKVLRLLTNASIDPTSLITCDHNHVALEDHDNLPTLIHRKGATPANANQPGMIPGSMGTMSFHTSGKGSDKALRSSSHGAGRCLTREQARRKISVEDLEDVMNGIWIDRSRVNLLVDESPEAYQDIRDVMRAQLELTRTTRRLQPLMVYKG